MFLNVAQINTTKLCSVHIQVMSGLVFFEFFGSVQIYEFGFCLYCPSSVRFFGVLITQLSIAPSVKDVLQNSKTNI